MAFIQNTRTTEITLTLAEVISMLKDRDPEGLDVQALPTTGAGVVMTAVGGNLKLVITRVHVKS